MDLTEDQMRRNQQAAIGLMDEICDWLRANDVTPGQVPLWAVPKIANGRMTMPVYLLRDGKKYLRSDGEPAMGSIDVPLKQEPPAALDQWLSSEEG